MRLHAVILAGGRGERFWPLSRRSRPKQFLPLLGGRPLLADTVDRVRGLVEPPDLWVLTSRDLKRVAEACAPSVPREQVLGEPLGKNTAPAIALASWLIEERGKDSVIAVLPSDHRVEPAERFREEIRRAAETALAKSAIVTFGIPPTRPETGYGYIEEGDAIEPGSLFHRVKAFREKPDPETAARYLAGGRHLWNAGMFVFPPRVMLEELRAHAPEIVRLLERVPRQGASGIAEALEGFYEEAPSISIDYAVMERSERALVARAGFAWDDLGSWTSLETPGSRDASGNVISGTVLLHDSNDVLAFSEGGLLAGIGLKNLVVVRTGEVTLVCAKDKVQEVRAIVEKLKSREDLDEYL